ncbi:DNA-formamidopyrimidine glycosylase family protein [Streptomyces sp. PmtA]|uniref:Fpg/Nei family DNA glycosylase n=1 Tax=Streptomyces sp. PmtA TaxID=3074275 RepID=UPI003FCC9C9D
MPELPDVEGFREVLSSCGRGRRVTRVEVRDPGVLRGVTVRRLRTEVEGERFGEPRRHGKWLIAPTDDGPALVWHFGMTGALLCTPADEPLDRHDRVVLTLDDERQLRYRDQRKLQGVQLAGNEAAVGHILADLGPDALSVSRQEFRELLDGRRGAVKNVLMDQSVVAGLGNLLTDEILWRAGVAPDSAAGELTEEETRSLHAAMRRVLALVRARRTRTSQAYLAHGPAGGPRPPLPALRRTAALPPLLGPPHPVVPALPEPVPPCGTRHSSRKRRVGVLHGGTAVAAGAVRATARAGVPRPGARWGSRWAGRRPAAGQGVGAALTRHRRKGEGTWTSRRGAGAADPGCTSPLPGTPHRAARPTRTPAPVRLPAVPTRCRRTTPRPSWRPRSRWPPC